MTCEEEEIDQHTAHLRFDICSRDDSFTRPIASRAGLIHGTLELAISAPALGQQAALLAAAVLPDLVGAVVSRGGRPDLAGPALSRVRAPTLLIGGG